VRHRRLLAISVPILLLVGCAAAKLENYKPKSQDEAQIVAALQKIPNGVNARSIDLLTQPYADDVYIGNFQRYLGVAGPTAPLSISKRDLGPVYTQLFRAAKEVSMDVKDLRLTVAGNSATAEASTELLLKQEAGRKEPKQGQVFYNEVIWRLKRTPLGWRIVEEIWR
jgi:ketosteroid isomerase-like protein